MQRALLSLSLACIGLLATSPGQAGPAAETYYFEVGEVVAKAEGVPKALVEQTRKAIEAEIRQRPEVMDELPEAAPDPREAPTRFERWLLRRNMRAFRVTVEITDFERTVESPEGRDQRLKVHVALHLFGESLPQRSFGFTGDGSATVVLEVGKAVRERDDTVARADALQLASQKAIAESVTQLREASKVKKPARKKRQPARKKKKKRKKGTARSTAGH